uniref:Uncharacterized protein n=2 Tax=Oryza sativa subsp. japonica TaxID=39947 RepID=A0A5S6R7P4_ORYSJ|nr:Hypothetical protein [Oryza sativa Japonica Group]AAP53447.1 hypothetical protein LOC_Os10g23940 [Oryza sativa Japonica Group]
MAMARQRRHGAQGDAMGGSGDATAAARRGARGDDGTRAATGRPTATRQRRGARGEGTAARRRDGNDGDGGAGLGVARRVRVLQPSAEFLRQSGFDFHIYFGILHEG